jgi:hypothetical protein
MKQQDRVAGDNYEPSLAAIAVNLLVRPSPTMPFVWNRICQFRFPFGSDNESIR